MSPIELERLLNTIAWGARYIKVTDSSGTEKILKIKDLDIEDRVWIDFVHEQATAEAKEAGLLSERELAVFLEKQGVWTSKEEKDIQNHLTSITKLKAELEEDISSREEKRLSRVIAGVEKSLERKQATRAIHFANSLERYAEDHRIKAIIYCVSLASDGTRFWKTWDDFCDESDHTLLAGITRELSRSRPISIVEIRRIARSPQWRSKWLASKTNDSLFGKPVINMTRNQETLVYWSQVYDSVYESIDRPPQSVIDDDAALDRWFEQQRKKRQTEEITSGKSNDFNISKKVGRHGEVGIVTNDTLVMADAPAQRGWGNRGNINTPSTGDVNELNNPLSKKFLEVQRKKLKSAGVIREQDLRQDSDSRRVIGASDVVFEKRKRPDGMTGKAVTKRYQGGTLKGRRLE